MSRRRTCALLLAALVAVLAVVAAPGAPAGAHAQLVGSTPGDGSVVARAPVRVSLEFSEGVTVDPGGIRVFDGAGRRVDLGNATASRNTAAVGLERALARGTYVVAWRAVSADSHPVHGGFTFSIGAPGAVRSGVVDSALDARGDRFSEAVAAALRGFAYAGAMLAAGGALFLLVAGDDDDRSLTAPLLTAGSVVAIGSALLGVPLLAALATGLGPKAITEPGVARLVLGDGVGLGLVALVVGQGLLVAVVRRPADGATGVLTVAGFTLGVGAFALSGHTRITDPPLLSTLADLVHVLAGAAWFGGIVVLLIALRRRHADDDPTGAAELIARFSTIVIVPLVLVSAAGVVLAWREVRVLDALTSTTYGRLLLVKVGLVALVIAAAAYNRYRLVPAVQAPGDPEVAEAGGHPKEWARLGRTLGFEIVGLLAAIAVTGVLVNVTPASTAAGVGKAASATVPLGTGTVNLTVDPARAGTNTIHIYLLDRTGRQVDRAQQLSLEFSLPSSDIGPIKALAVKAAPGHWQYDGNDLSLAGRWDITVVATVSRFDEQRATAHIAIRP